MFAREWQKEGEKPQNETRRLMTRGGKEGRTQKSSHLLNDKRGGSARGRCSCWEKQRGSKKIGKRLGKQPPKNSLKL